MSAPNWRKSSYTTADGECVEVADLGPTKIGLRDSKNTGLGYLTLPTYAFRDLLTHLKESRIR